MSLFLLWDLDFSTVEISRVLEVLARHLQASFNTEGSLPSIAAPCLWRLPIVDAVDKGRSHIP